MGQIINLYFLLMPVIETDINVHLSIAKTVCTVLHTDIHLLSSRPRTIIKAVNCSSISY